MSTSGKALDFVLGRYDRRSAVVAAATVGLCSLVGITWWELLLCNLSVVDWFLVLLWVFMTATLSWDIRIEKDLSLFFSAACGGLVIEWWGTNTELWHYFTRERPPLWIIVAWPVAALSTDRIAFALHNLAPHDNKIWRIAYWVLLPTFVAGMTRFIWPSIGLPASQLVVVLMLLVAATGRTPRRDVLLFVAGSLLGIFLEYWGTSRHCWTYYSREIPPVIAVFAHGFSSVAFQRATSVAVWFARKSGRRWSGGSRVD